METMNRKSGMQKVRLGLAIALALFGIHSAASAAENRTGWELSMTPVLVAAKDGYDMGGGADPELRYTRDMGDSRLSAGWRVGVYYARNRVGITATPTLRLTVPVGAFEPYVAMGMGYGWIPETEEEGMATLSRAGFTYRFSRRFTVGLEGTAQRIDGTEFSFPSLGSMVSVDL